MGPLEGHVIGDLDLGSFRGMDFSFFIITVLRSEDGRYRTANGHLCGRVLPLPKSMLDEQSVSEVNFASVSRILEPLTGAFKASRVSSLRMRVSEGGEHPRAVNLAAKWLKTGDALRRSGLVYGIDLTPRFLNGVWTKSPGLRGGDVAPRAFLQFNLRENRCFVLSPLFSSRPRRQLGAMTSCFEDIEPMEIPLILTPRDQFV